MSTVSTGVSIIVHRLGHGGTDRVAVLLANGFVKAGVPTDLVLFAGCGAGEQVLSMMMDPGVRIVQFSSRSTGRAADLIRGLPSFRRYLLKEKPSTLLASGNNVALIAALGRALFSKRSRMVVKVTNPIIRPRDKLLNRWWRGFIYRGIFGIADVVLPLSEAERRVLGNHFPPFFGKMKAVLNPYVTASMLDTKRLPPERPGSGPVLMTIGRLHHQKNQELMLRAMACPGMEKCRLVILGEGPDRPKLEALALELGIADRVEMPGFAADVPDWLAGADMFVLSSDYEGLPAVVLEALACGCPVVTTNSFPAAVELLENAMGCRVVATTDPSVFARSIIAALQERPDPVALRAIAQQYTVEAAVHSHLAAIDFQPQNRRIADAVESPI